MKTTPIGTRLAKARAASKLSAAALGEKAGLSHAIVSMIESGARKDPSSTTVSKLAKVLKVSVDWLINGTGPGPDEGDEPAKAPKRHRGAA